MNHPPSVQTLFKGYLASDPRFLAWLAAEKESAMNHLKKQTESVGIFRAQGRLALLDEMEALLK